jgi:3-phenylpropionate/trans-cinnamate dioxygenase ferredoxin reductase component
MPDLKSASTPARRTVIVGAGHAGGSVAAFLRQYGFAGRITLVGEEPVPPYQRPPLSKAWLKGEVDQAALELRPSSFYSQNDIDLRVQTTAEAIDRSGQTVRLSSGTALEYDWLILATGARARRVPGLPCGDGVLVDSLARTVDPRVYAIGDCTRRPLPLYDGHFRLESVPNAIEQAKQAAAAICGRTAPAPEPPWFWSDQFDLKLQIAGLPVNATQTVVRGDPQAARSAIFHLGADATVRAVEAVNSPPEFMMGRQMIVARTQVAIEHLRDPRISMREVARQARESCPV